MSHFLVQEMIRQKRDGQIISKADLESYIQGVTDGSISEGQIAAFCMSIFFNGMERDERTALTLAMRDSGTTLEWADCGLSGPVVDKHSTGGIGDVVSLMLAPMLAACGAFVPMISGRGLGHTGGTLDKLESIAGFDMYPDTARLREIVKSVGCAIIGQTSKLAPADGKIYAIRDITATVESIDLITASILSKKLAEGLNGLVMDVKVGNGAFMPTYEASKALARSIVEVANRAGCHTTALLTDMNQPLASSAGNAVEVREAVRYLTGESRNPRLHEVTLALGAELLVSTKLAENRQAAIAALEASLASGKAAEIFDKMVVAQGGSKDFCANYQQLLPVAPVIKPVFAPTEGFIAGFDTRAVGIAVIGLGGGRRVVSDKIDHRVGFDGILGLGAKVDTQTPIATIHATSQAHWEQAAKAYLAAVQIAETAPESTPTVYETIA